MTLYMNATVRADLLEAHKREAESAGDLGTPYSNRIIEAIENLADGVPLDSVELPEVDEDQIQDLSDAEVVVMTMDFHYGNFTPEAWVS